MPNTPYALYGKKASGDVDAILTATTDAKGSVAETLAFVRFFDNWASRRCSPLRAASRSALPWPMRSMRRTRGARRAVEVDAEHEDQLVAWLSKRMGARMQAPRLHALGYELVGGRLLPGESKPVAQFMYQDGSGSKLTLYASNELPGAGVPTATPNADTAFSFAQRGALNTFYWVDGEFGYALSAGADRAELARVSAEVYRQLASGARQ